MKTSTKMVTFLRRIAVLSVLLVALIYNANAQISVSGAGALNGTYTTFTNSSTGLFAALNASNQTGNNIVVSVTANVSEPTTGVALTGAAGMWSSLTIKPSGGAWTVSAAATTDLIDFSGASNVTIDGLNSGGNALTISNTTAGSAAAIRFINDANNIKIKNCTITGSANASQKAVIMFATGTTTGNDNIRITGCDIGAAGTNYPTNCIFSLGTSITVDNSSDTLDNNKIHDFYSNTLPSFGVHLNNTNASSSNNWLVDNNRLYQTVSRAYTTASTHQVLVLGTGAGHVCTNNIIGFASSTGTGTYTITSGTGATRLVGISVTNTDLTGTPISVQGNTITGISVTSSNTASTTTATFIGINITGTGNANIGTVTGNTIGSISGTGSIAVIAAASGGGAVGICNATTGTISISNNNIGSMSVTSATAGNTLGLYGIYGGAISTLLTVNNNTIGNSTANNMIAGTSGTSTGATSVGGIICASVPASLVVSNNTIRNLNSYGASTSSFVRGIASGTSGITASANIFNNTVFNLSSASLLANASSGQTSSQGIQLGSGLNAKIYGNTIYNISNSNTTASTTNIIVSGIGLTGAQSTSVYNNKIYGLSNANTGTTNTAPPMAVGIVIRSGNTNDSIYNNMISLGNGQTGNTVFVGILGNHASTPDPISYIFHNTINIEGTVTSGALPSFCLHRGDFTTTLRAQTYVIKNNIFTNSRSGGTGKHYAIGNNFNGTGTSTGWTSDFNILNSANTATVGYTTAADQTFANWQTAMSGDVNSFTAATVTYTNSANDLHINMGTSNNFIESYGDAAVGIATDFDGQARPGPAGSVNGGAVAPDLGADEFDGHLTYTCVAPIATTVNASVNPVTCYGSATVLSLNSQASYTGSGYQYQWQVSSNNSSFSDISGATLPTYSAVPNAATTYYRCTVTCPSGPSTITSSSITITAPTIMTGGTYTINSGVATSGTNYNTFTEAFNDLNCRGIAGPIVFNVASGTTYTDQQVSLNQVTGSSNVNTITFNGNGATFTFNSSLSTNRTGIVLNGADYVTIDNLVINATGTYGWGIHLIGGADHNTISNCAITTSTTSTASNNTACIWFSASTAGFTAGLTGSYNNISGNTLKGGYYTIGITGTSVTYETDNSFSNNIIQDYYAYGFYAANQLNLTFTGNNISRPTRTNTTTSYAINCASGGSGYLINNNQIHNLFDGFANTHTNITTPIILGSTGTLAAPNYAYNNIIYNVNGNGTLLGLQVSSSYWKVYHNTIVLNYANTTTAQTDGIQIATSNVCDVKNNLVYITRGGTGTKRCIYITLASTNLTCDYNNYYLNPPAGTTNYVGQYQTTTYASLLAWKGANTGTYDASGRSLDPVFADVINNDYTPTSGSLDNLGTPVGIATDIANNTRSNSIPDIGAYEFTGTGCIDPPTPGTATSTSSNVCNGVDFTLNVSGNTIGAGQTYQWQMSTDDANWSNVGSAQSTQSLTTTQTSDHYYRVGLTCSGGSTVYSTSVFVTTNPLMNGSYTINQNAAATSTNFTSFTSAISAMGCGIAGPVVLNVVANSGPYNEQIVITPITGASSANTITINGNGNTVVLASTNSNLRVGLEFNGADFIKVDSLNIDVSGGTYGWGVLFRNNADYNKLSKCTVNAGVNTVSSNYSAIVFAASNTSQTAGNTGNYDTLVGNTIKGGYYGLYLLGPTSSPYAQGNAFINNTLEDSYSYQINMQYQNGALFSGNDISKPNRTSFTTGYGIYLSGSDPNVIIEKNKIHDLFAQQPTNTTSCYAMYVSVSSTAGTEPTIKNNLIYNMNSAGVIYGIYILGSYVNIYHNTIILDQSAGGSGSNFGINIGSNYTNLNIKNNFIYNSSSSTGAKRCLYYATSTIGANNNVDYNYYYVSNNYGTDNKIAALSTTSLYATLADWQASGNGLDANSISTVTNFVDAANGNYRPTSTSVNDKGTYLGIDFDINDSLRSNTTPDIGCFEFDIQGCTNPPTTGTVTSTTLKACSGDNFILDITGNSIGLGQTYQWQISTNNSSWTDVGGLLDSTTSYTTSQSSDHFYRIKVTCNLGTPAYSSSIFISTPTLVNGTFTVDQTQPTGGNNFATLTEAADYISCGINGPVVFNVATGTGPYNEQVHLGVIPGASATNTITFNGNGESLVFSSTNTSDRGGFALIGTDHVTINNFVIDGSAGTYGTGVLLTSQADSNTVSNCVINMGLTSTSSNFAGITISGSASATATGLNGNYNTIIGNTINGGYYAITIVGSSSVRGIGNNVINNQVKDCYFYNIYASYERDGIISGNEISRPNRLSYGSGYCIYLTTGVLNYVVEKNKIHNLFDQAPTATSATYGIYVVADATSGSENVLKNNLIYNIGGNGTIYAINDGGGDYLQVYHNTISLNGTDATTGITYGIYQSTAATGISIMNNIVSITRSGTGVKRCLYYNTTTSAITSNNNNLYMNAASGSDNKVGQFGTLSYTDIAAWKTANTGAYDQNSVSVDPLFVNAASGNYVAKATGLSGVGATNLGVTTDFLGNARTIYFTPGAYESDNTAPVISNSIVTSSCASSVGASSIDINAVNITDASGISTSGANMPKVYFKKGNSGGWSVLNGTMASGTAINSNWDFSIPYSSVGGANTGDVVNYFIVAQDLSTYPNVASNATGLTASSVTSISVYPTTGNSVAINAVTPSVSISTASDTVCSGSNVTFTSNITNGGSSPSVQWKRNNLNVGSGSSITFLSGTLNNGDNITCILTANNTCQTSATANSNVIHLTVNPSPAMSQTTNYQGIVTTATMCTLGTTVRYYNTTYGGSWSSSAAGIASVDSKGIVTANANGTAIISFSKASTTSSCVSTSTVTITVAQATAPNAITGTNQVCVNSTINLSNTTNGGVWSSFNNRGIINSGGVFTGKNAGAGEVRYTVTNASGCTAYSSFPVTVNAIPNVPTINYASGTTNPQNGAPTGSYCVGKTFTVVGTPNVPAGVWSATGVASVTSGGVVTINAVGAGTLKYTYTTAAGCTSSRTISGSGYTCAARGTNTVEGQLSNVFGFTMYPNPATSKINLQVETLIGKADIVITDLFGKQIKMIPLSLGNNTIDISSLTKGFYFVSMITANGKSTQKLIVE